MPLLVLLLLVAVFVYLYITRRGSTLTRECRWRQDRRSGPQDWRCASCGARTTSDRSPRHCLREPPSGDQQ